MPITLYNNFIERPQWSADNSTIPAFMAYGSGSPNITVTGWQTVTNLNQVRINVGNHWNATNDIFTAPFAGIYVFGYNQRLDGADSGYHRIIISYNDTTSVDNNAHSIVQGSSVGGAYHTMSITGLYNMNAGDTIRAKVYSDNDNNYYHQYESQLWGHLVSSRN